MLSFLAVWTSSPPAVPRRVLGLRHRDHLEHPLLQHRADLALLGQEGAFGLRAGAHAR